MLNELLTGSSAFWVLLAVAVLAIVWGGVQAREAASLKQKLQKVLSNRQVAAVQAGAEVFEPDWFLAKLQSPVCLIDITTRRVLTVNPVAQDWMGGLGISTPESLLDESLANGDDGQQFPELRRQVWGARQVARRFSDRLWLNIDGREKECTIDLSVLPFQRGESHFLLVFMGELKKPEARDGILYRRLIDATLTEPNLTKALQSIALLLEADMTPGVYATISALSQKKTTLELVCKLGLPEVLTAQISGCPFVHGAGVHATAGVMGQAMIQHLRHNTNALPASLSTAFLEAGIHCWASYPIFGLYGDLLGTFDVYLADERKLEALSEKITLAMRLAAATLERHGSLQDIQETVKRESFIRAFHQALMMDEDTEDGSLYEASLARIERFCGVESRMELWVLDSGEQYFKRLTRAPSASSAQSSSTMLGHELVASSFKGVAPAKSSGDTVLKIGSSHEIYREILGNSSEYGINQAVLQPLYAGSVLEGFFVWLERGNVPDGYVDLVQSVAPGLAASLARKRLMASLEQQALYDHLTGLYSRRKIEDSVQRLIDKTVRYQGVFSILLFDIDRFKLINDTLGHSEGDSVLQQVSHRVRQGVRGSDLVSRWGGEEFLAVLPETDLASAEMAGEQVRELVASGRYGKAGKITVSIGVATYRKGDSVEALVKKADQAMYEAKSAGRNCVIVNTQDRSSD